MPKIKWIGTGRYSCHKKGILVYPDQVIEVNSFQLGYLRKTRPSEFEELTAPKIVAKEEVRIADKANRKATSDK